MKDFEQELNINIYKLHLEWQRQPQFYFDYAKKHAVSLANSKRIEEQLKILKAEAKLEQDQARAIIDIEIRNSPAYRNKKPTETAINNMILNNEEYLAVINTNNNLVKEKTIEHISAIEETETLFAALNAIIHRKSALENEVKLYLGGYFSEPKSEGAENMMEEKRKAIISGLKHD